MNSLTNDNILIDKDDNDDNDNEVKLWEDLEEKDLLEIPLSSSSSNPLKLSLRQYVSSDIQWGIHSSVWEGGLAMLAFLMDSKSIREMTKVSTSLSLLSSSSSLMVIDLGSGTGITGLGLAATMEYNAISSPTDKVEVLLTDLKNAMPLLNENIERNQHLLHNDNVKALPLEWGKELPSYIHQCLASSSSFDDVLVLGADIVYRQNIMNPLIQTLRDILSRCYQGDSNCCCLLSIHSIRSHLSEFLIKCQDADLEVLWVASVTLPEDKVQSVVAGGSLITVNHNQHEEDMNIFTGEKASYDRRDGHVCIFQIQWRVHRRW